MRVLIACLCFVIGLRYATPIVNFNSSSDGNSIIYRKYFEMDKELQKMFNQGIKRMLPTLMEANEHLNISGKCMKETFTLFNGLRKLKFWALNFVDASGKLPDGILSGNILILGDFDQCLKATVNKKDGSLDFRGQYCLVSYAPILPKPKRPMSAEEAFDGFVSATRNSSDFLRYLAETSRRFRQAAMKIGVCVPSGCCQEDIEQIVKYFGEKVMFNTGVDSCQVEGWYNTLNTRSIVIIFIFCIYGCLGIIGSWIEYFLKVREVKPKSTLTNILLCFSITSNFQNLMNTKTAETSLLCFHGIKVLSLFYIILSHEHLLFAIFPAARHLAFLKEYTGRFFTQIVINGFFTVDVFFFLGGFLHSYTRTNKEGTTGSQNGKPGFFQMILFRIWRLAPTYIFTVLLSLLMVPRGPFVPTAIKVYEDACRHWWRNLLFISNFFNPEDVCLLQSWYISADMQLFLLSLFAVGLLIRNPKKGMIFNGVLLLSGILGTVAYCYVLDAAPTILFYRADRELINKFSNVYMSPLPHMPPYFIGIFIGYYVAVKKEIKISKIYQVLGWPVAALFCTSTLFVSMKWNREGDVTRVESALYFALGRFIYSLGIAWMVVCCITGHGGIINYILSLKLWIPLSRISYAVYLLSPVVQMFNILNKRYLFDFHEMHLVWQHMGDLAICCLLGLTLVIIFESPSIALQKLLLQKKVADTKSPAKPLEGIENGGLKTFEAMKQQDNNERNVSVRL